jgi:probable F420-dependent oxidoreductase
MMKIGLGFGTAYHGAFSKDRLFARLVTTLESCGFESLWIGEHVAIPVGYQSQYPYGNQGRHPAGSERPFLYTFDCLSFAAALTSKLKLGTNILILPQQHPLYVAKHASTLDVLSEGRLILGVGSGWLKEEFDALGWDFSTRGPRTDEAIMALRALWREVPCTFRGKFFNFGPLNCMPQPLQKGGVPIYYGGWSNVAARRTARLCDGFIPPLFDPPQLKKYFEIIRLECLRIGRNPKEVDLNGVAPNLTLDAVKQMEDLGVTRIITAPPDADADTILRVVEAIGNDIIAKL